MNGPTRRPEERSEFPHPRESVKSSIRLTDN